MKTTSFAIIALLCLALTGCGDIVGNDSGFVGGSCRANADCEERCVRNGDFPDGMCTIACDFDEDCPDGSRCIDREDGICALSCDENRDCRADYLCRSQDRRGDRGEAQVCVGD